MSRTAVPVLIATCVLAGLAALSFVSRPLVPSPAGASNLRAFSESPSSSGGLGIYSCVKDACLQGADDDWVKICNDKSCYSNCTFDDDEWYEVWGKAAIVLYLCVAQGESLKYWGDVISAGTSRKKVFETKFLRQSFWFYIHAWEYYVRWILVLLRWRVVAVGVSLSSKYAG